MKIIGTIPIQTVEFTTNGTDPTQAVRQFIDLHPKVRIESIDGHFVRGLCEGCGVPIMQENTDHAYDGEAQFYFCVKCKHAAAASANPPKGPLV